MASNGKQLQKIVLKTLQEFNHEFVILHGEDEFFRLEITSDLDLACSIHPKKFILALSEILVKYEVILIFISRYDFGAFSTFWYSLQSKEYFQLDVISDKYAIGKLGIKTSICIESAVVINSLPVSSELNKTFYIVSKRFFKNIVFKDTEEFLIRKHKSTVTIQDIKKVARASGKIRIFKYFNYQPSLFDKAVACAYSFLRKFYRIILRPGLVISAGSKEGALIGFETLVKCVPEVKIYPENKLNMFKIWTLRSKNIVIIIYPNTEREINIETMIREMNFESLKRLR